MDSVINNDDLLFEILMRVDPDDVFNCFLVSKDWLEMITTRNFGKKYLLRWKNNTKLIVGLLMHEIWVMGHDHPREGNFLPTTNLGRQLNDNTLMPAVSRIGFFLSKSPNSSHMLFARTGAGAGATSLHVWTGGPTIGSPLPPPPVLYRWFMAHIVSDDGDDYKVIIAEDLVVFERNTIRIQTFSSSTWRWEQSTLTCSTPFNLDCGSLTRSCGVIYWVARSRGLIFLVAWDMNDDSNSLSLIFEPHLPSSLKTPFYEGREISISEIPIRVSSIHYGVSPNGSLLSAALERDRDNGLWMIKIFCFDENTEDWNLLHHVRQGTIWTNNLALLSSLFGDRVPDVFVFVSFLPGRLDSILLGIEQHLFVCYFESQKLEYLEYLKYGYYNRDGGDFSFNVNYHPLTMMDLGVWLSSPLSTRLSHQSKRRKL